MNYKRSLLLLFVLSTAILSSCIYGPETKDKNASDIFNKKNYEGPIVGYPILKAKKRNTIIEGIARNTDYTPVKFQKVILLNKTGVKVSEATTTLNGSFAFMDLIENGIYVVRTESECCSGEIKIKVDGYQLENLILVVKPNDILP